ESGKSFAPHVHVPLERALVGTSEFVFVMAGTVHVDFLADDAVILDRAALSAGMAFLQIRGGHAISTDPSTHFFEIKQGPYCGVKADKVIGRTRKSAVGCLSRQPDPVRPCPRRSTRVCQL